MASSITVNGNGIVSLLIDTSSKLQDTDPQIGFYHLCLAW